MPTENIIPKLPKWMIDDLREQSGLDDTDDTSNDLMLSENSVEQLFDRYCSYNGIIGYASTLIEVLDALRKAKGENNA